MWLSSQVLMFYFVCKKFMLPIFFSGGSSKVDGKPSTNGGQGSVIKPNEKDQGKEAIFLLFFISEKLPIPNQLTTASQTQRGKVMLVEYLSLIRQIFIHIYEQAPIRTILLALLWLGLIERWPFMTPNNWRSPILKTKLWKVSQIRIRALFDNRLT